LINGVKKNYLTYRWSDVVSSCLSPSDEAATTAIGASSFPSDAARDSEISELVLLTGSLTDVQKVAAEFWAGGPGTASPPGICMWFWKEFMISRNIPYSCDFDTFFYSGFDLAQHIFETSRVVWGLKKAYMQARPIQEVRRIYRQQALTKYDGTTIQGESWIPYQETNFITPPFADFPSGHSTYSQKFALVMTDWFGARIPESAPRELSDLSLISGTFAGPETLKYGQFFFRAGRSAIQPTVVPATDIELVWTTWQDMANSAGISRKYGGIHATSAHVGGQAVANTLHSLIRSKSGLTV
jgi:membrane-associated phospholipid phosphatase